MKYSIKKGRHYCSPLFFDILVTKYPSIKRTVTFSFDTPYNLDGSENTMEGDDFDCNKLLGLGFVNFHKLKMHHYESCRVGWVWNSETHKVDLYAYIYRLGVRFIELIKSVSLGIPIDITVTASRSSYHIMTYNQYDYKNQTTSNLYDRGLKSPIAYLLGPYFGGNEPAPHKMDIFIS